MNPFYALAAILGALGVKHFFYDLPLPLDALTLCASLVSAPSGSSGDFAALESQQVQHKNWVTGHRIAKTFEVALTSPTPTTIYQINMPVPIYLLQIAACLQSKGYFALAQQFTVRASQFAAIPS